MPLYLIAILGYSICMSIRYLYMIAVLRLAKLKVVLTLPFSYVPTGSSLQVAKKDCCFIVLSTTVLVFTNSPCYHTAVNLTPGFSTYTANTSAIIFTNFAPRPFLPDASLFISLLYYDDVFSCPNTRVMSMLSALTFFNANTLPLLRTVNYLPSSSISTSI